MMAAVRVIPRLDIKGPNLVKGIHLEGLRPLGPPEAFAQHYYQEGADEILYIDAVASLYNRNSLTDVVRRTSSEIFVPLCVGGGLRTIEDIATVLGAGADKVAINTAAINDPDFLRQAVRKFGSSTIVVSIQAARRPDGGYNCFTDSGREATGKDVLEWSLRAAELGAGELLVTSIDREGTGEGYDINLIRQIAEPLGIPVIACGGAGTASHVAEAVIVGKADAVCLASTLHYDTAKKLQIVPHEGIGIGYSADKINPDTRITLNSVRDLKDCLYDNGIDVRR